MFQGKHFLQHYHTFSTVPAIVIEKLEFKMVILDLHRKGKGPSGQSKHSGQAEV